jgi:pyruvate formate-lyase activating enzyme-like uncharacterized protein
MVEWQSDFVGSIYNYLPPGCVICRQGAGLVLFVTGRCKRDCFYCPISTDRRGRDVVYADESPVHSIEDILAEARAIGALGTGITGGEPLQKLEYVLACIRALKREFGLAHHIHLYTGLLPGLAVLQRLREAGLDEIRFHPPPSDWSHPLGLERALQEAKSLGLEAGVEIPALKAAPEIVAAVRAEQAFLNINELEFSETNFDGLTAHGFQPLDLGCEASGSEEIAREHFLKEDMKVHYCPSRFKDAVQLRERLKRRAERSARPFDYMTEDGTLVHGVIEGDLQKAVHLLADLEVPEEMYSLRGGRIEIAAPILEDISKELKSIDCIISVIERYPLDDGLVVERIAL